MDTQTQIERLIELAIVQRTELKELVAQLPQLREHLNAEVEKAFEEAEPQLRSELEEWTTKEAQDKTAALGAALEAKITDLAKSLEISTQARYNAIIAEREENTRLAAQAEQKIAEHAASLPSAVKDIVTAELARFPRAGEIDQLRKEFAEPKSLNPRGKWQAGETYNKLDLVTINGDSYTSAIDGNKTRPTRSSADWTLVAARGTGGGGGPTSLTDLTAVPQNGELLIGNGSAFVNNTLTAGTGVTITNGAGTITIDASGAQELLTATVKNADSVAITKGQVVYLFGATGGFPSVKLASNTSDATSNKTFGVVSDTSIAPNGTGTVTCVGVVDGLNLAAYNDGDAVYLGASAGTFTATKPYAPNHLVFVGIIERANMGNGELYVRIQNGYELEELHNVQITTPPLAGSLLMYDATNSLWKANRLTGGTNIAVTNADTSVTLGLTGTVAVANGGTGVTTSTGTGSVVLSNTPTLVTPNIGAATGTSVTLTGNATASDLILGTSGPSAKSSIAARAARQGLVFDGTVGATVASVAAFGTGDFTFASWVNPTSLAAGQYLIGGALAAGSFNAAINATTGVLTAYNGTSYTPSPNQSVVAGKWQLVVYRRASGVLYVSVNAGTEGSVACTENFSTVTSEIGALDGTGFFKGQIIPLIYNRALSAAEVVSLYEAGVPSGADYNSANNTGFVTGDNSTFASDTGFWTRGANVAITGGEAVWTGASSLNRPSISLLAGKRYLFTINITQASTNGWSWYNGSAYVSTGITGTGVQSAVLIPVANTGFYITNGDGTNGKITDLTLIPQGLLLAPDAAQAGGGLVWYDTSGNAANITLPASGVSWNVPSSLVLGGNWTTSGNLTVSGTGTSALTSSSANLVVGSTTATSTNAVGVPQITTESDLYSSICSIAHNNTNGNHGFLMVGKSRGTKASPTILADGDVFGELAFVAYDGAAYRTAGQIRSVIAGTPGATDLPCALDFRVAPDGSSTPAPAMRIAPTGNLLIGTTTDGGQKLQVAGVANSSGAGYTNSGFQITNTSASRTVGLFLSNAGVTTIRDVTGAADLFTISLLGAATFGGTVTGGLITSQANDTSSGIVVKRSASPYIDFYDGGTSGTIRAEILADNDGVSGGNFKIQTRNAAGTGVVLAATFDKNQDVTFAGFVGIKDGMTAPSATAGTAKIYVDTADGDLKVIFGDGTIKTIATDT